MRHSMLSACAVGFGLWASSLCHAAPVQSNLYNGTSAGLPVLSGDLLETSVSSVVLSGSVGGFLSSGSVNLGVLTDGQLGNVGAVFSNTNVAPNASTVLTYNFNLAANPGGYDIAQIITTASWDTGRDGQEYSVLYSTVAAPSTFLPLYTIAPYNPVGVPFNPTTTSVTLSDSNGFSLATSVASLRFTFTSFENNGTAYREFDVVSSVVPEPSSLGLVGVAGLMLARRRR